MTRKVQAVVENKGGHTKYWLSNLGKLKSGVAQDFCIVLLSVAGYDYWTL